MKSATALTLPLGASRRQFYAGSFKNFPGKGYYGIKLAPEVNVPAHLVVKIPDFGLPRELDTYSALRVLLYQAALGRKVYIGCMGGYGRTGTFLALLYRLLGVKDSIEFVREIYDSHAVETEAQEHFVKTLFTGPLRYDLMRARYTALMVDAARADRDSAAVDACMYGAGHRLQSGASWIN